MKNKPFFILKFKNEVNVDDFNKKYAKNKRIKARIPSEDVEEKNYIKEEDYLPIEDVRKPGEKLTK